MPPQPSYCKISLRVSTKILAIMYLNTSMLFILGGIGLVIFEKGHILPVIMLTDEVPINFKTLGIVAIVVGAIKLIGSLFLWNGTKKKSVWRLRVFLGMQLLCVLTSITASIRFPSSPVSILLGMMIMTHSACIVQSLTYVVRSKQQPRAANVTPN